MQELIQSLLKENVLLLVLPKSLRPIRNYEINKNLEESKMSDHDRIENEYKKNLKRNWELKVQRENGNKSPNRKGK